MITMSLPSGSIPRQTWKPSKSSTPREKLPCRSALPEPNANWMPKSTVWPSFWFRNGTGR